MKKYRAVLADFFCAAMFGVNAWGFGVTIGVQEGRDYYVLLGLVWLAGAIIWTVRGVHALKTTKDSMTEREKRHGK